MHKIIMSREQVLNLFRQYDDLTLVKESWDKHWIHIPEFASAGIMCSDSIKERDDHYKRLVIYLTENMI